MYEKAEPGTSLVVQSIRICLAMHGVQVRSLIGDLRYHVLAEQLSLLAPTTKPCASGQDPTCHSEDLTQPSKYMFFKKRKLEPSIPLITSFVNFGKLLRLSDPLFPHFQNGGEVPGP